MKSCLPICWKSVLLAKVQTTEDTYLEQQYGGRVTMLITAQPTSCKCCLAEV